MGFGLHLASEISHEAILATSATSVADKFAGYLYVAGNLCSNRNKSWKHFFKLAKFFTSNIYVCVGFQMKEDRKLNNKQLLRLRSHQHQIANEGAD